ncbi:MAG TPA: metal-sensitive transcriptional regulator [Acidimicrobiales bacterium]|nr:metal-sensitive transcriptional regulator [Acidimicrobiales bacterium]
MRGYTMNRENYLLRLRKIEGQVRGLQKMIESDEYCIDVLTQLSSVTAALQGVAIGLVDEHLRHCVMQASNGDSGERDAKLTEAVRAVERLVRS